LVSKVDHALLELLWRHARGSCLVKLPVISNHEDLREAVENFGIPFTVVPVTKDNKAKLMHKLMK
jgi:formyltetrahydrofolate deformylase